MGVIIKNYVKNLKNEKAQYIFIGFPLIISMCVGLTLRGKMFEDYSDTRSRLFAIVCVAIWIGLFNSVLEICKERDSIKMDLNSGFNAFELFTSRFLVQGAVCLFQAIIIFIVCSLFVEFPSEGAIMSPSVFEYILSIFLIIFSADVMGLFISSLCTSNDIANRSLPFILIVRLIFSAQLFEFTISKWGMDLLGSIGNISDLKSNIPIEEKFFDAFEFTSSHVIGIWAILLLFIIIFSILSMFFINRIKAEQK